MDKARNETMARTADLALAGSQCYQDGSTGRVPPRAVRSGPLISMSSPSGATMVVDRKPDGSAVVTISGGGALLPVELDLTPDWVVALREALEPSTLCPAGASCYLLDVDTRGNDDPKGKLDG